jgi:hypothetical protein
MALQKYIEDAAKQYSFRLKAVVPIDDTAMDRIEMVLAKYDLLTISKPYKTIVQRAPLDFPQLRAAEVYILDLTLGLPVAPHILKNDIRDVLNAPEDSIVLRTRSEPGEIESENLNALADIAVEAERRGLKPAALLNDTAYDDADPMDSEHQLYGNGYNSAFLSHLQSVRQERDDLRQRVANAPFQWLDLPDRKDPQDFNAAIADAPKVYTKAVKRTEPIMSLLGNTAPARTEIRKVYIDDKGDRVVLTRKLADAR